MSTDDDEIAEVARAAGADVPFLRSADLAGDDVPTIPVVADALARDWPTSTVRATRSGSCIRPRCCSSPQISCGPRDEFLTSGATVAMSVVESPGPIERAWRRSGDGWGRMVSPEHVETRTQDLEPAFFDAGQFYVAHADFWIGGATLADVEPLLVPLPRERAIDIDTVDDWRFAESVFAGRVADEQRQRVTSAGGSVVSPLRPR